jgi:hypothetical protein
LSVALHNTQRSAQPRKLKLTFANALPIRGGILSDKDIAPLLSDQGTGLRASVEERSRSFSVERLTRCGRDETRGKLGDGASLEVVTANQTVL